MLKGCENCSTFLVRKFAVLFHLGQSKSHHFPTLGAIHHERQEKKTNIFLGSVLNMVKGSYSVPSVRLRA